MVVQKTVNNLKDRPKDERKVVAGGIAITVIAVLLLCWAILFFKRIQNGTQQVNFDTGAQGEFDFSNVKDAQQQIQQQSTYNNTNELYQIRQDAAAQSTQGEQELQIQQIQNDSDAFGNSSSY